jgi:cellulose synthase/poly-beta-1,6-N-acetylglucosamine synthase-like glycosyltransferase
MWAKNGEATLPVVLKQINRVIPQEVINNKIMVDDQSRDHTRQIGTEFGWKVISNEGHGISDGANTALKHVQTPTFCSFEQDIVLNPQWFTKVYPLIFGENVVVASGMRIASGPSAVRKIELLGYDNILSEFASGARSRRMRGAGVSFDNTVYRTDFMRSIGGFDYVKSNAGQDFSLFLKLLNTKKWLWEVNYDVVSLHLKPNSYINELKHQRWYASAFRETYTLNGYALPTGMHPKAYLYKLAKSPLSSLKLTKKIQDPFIFLYYPAFCLAQMIGVIEGKRFEHKLICPKVAV